MDSRGPGGCAGSVLAEKPQMMALTRVIHIGLKSSKFSFKTTASE